VFDARVLIATLLVTAATGVVCGLAPALQATRPDLTEAMKTGDSTADHRAERWLGGLLVGQVALTVVLLVGAGLFVRSLRNLDILDLGFDVQQLLRARVTAQQGGTRLDADALAHRLLANASSLPGVERVALATAGPFGIGMMKPVFVPDRVAEENPIPPGMSAVTPDFFRALGIPLEAGRAFESTDRVGTEPVAIVNDAMAKHLWPSGDAIGKCIKVADPNAPCARVVGVVGNARQGNIVRQSIQYEQLHDGFYVPLEQQPAETRVGVFGIMLYVRAKTDGAALVPALTKMLIDQAPGPRAPDVVAFATAVEPQIRPWRVGVMMFGVFGIIGLVLAVIGLHGVLAFRVAQRTREIGVRLALGATPRDVYRVVVDQGLRLGALGIAIGSVGALTIGHGLGTLLFGVSPRDPVVLLSIAATLLVVVVLASLIPAYRANRIDPIEALRDL
jgi:predicted permease